jgi:hypothetical protein
MKPNILVFAIAFFPLFLLGCSNSSAPIDSNPTQQQNVLTRIDSTDFDGIWGWPVFNGKDLSLFTTTGNPAQIYMRKFDTTGTQTGSLKQITSTADPQTSGNVTVTDDAILYLNNQNFIAFSRLDTALYIFKTDINGQRISKIVTVTQNSKLQPTNDMILTTDGTYLYLLNYSPPFNNVVHKFDEQLNLISTMTTTSILDINNLASAFFVNSYFYYFSGNGFGPNISLVLTVWNNDWSLAYQSVKTLIKTSNGDGNYQAQGSVYDSKHERWYVGFMHLNHNTGVDNEHVDLAVFDKHFNLLQRLHLSPAPSARVHLALVGNLLFVMYDYYTTQHGVRLLRYRISG